MTRRAVQRLDRGANNGRDAIRAARTLPRYRDAISSAFEASKLATVTPSTSI